ncbi:hypothetical protein LTR91_001264 [Friedmanniomyces endolithicus]|uniref:Peptidase metallopeptidase domain-containing protein n=1 Tax=Friedmanniomyces endolithicus TaxID=329885 RepID=A0AAN6R1H7_9PEZI|nr:hypothetical protein LTR35_012561 [Friedmanniomyces endolithicus]KAK0283914.1 hypothetical protein LTS00_011578 [Friedmanniomyces endolithicus]KAK0990358.1 hypothetical protein LTR54_012110 [Friedmanniomyces endolithicus]KAK1013057.1 hypothetical protein LTS01_000870 [Friedmanniomyces endolithicus]KAK1013668.1 hypothetical protein LTR91_001264 [Friedmanniomyces endolithicus]
MSTTTTTQPTSTSVTTLALAVAAGSQSGPPAPGGDKAASPATTAVLTDPQSSTNDELGIPDEHFLCMQMLDPGSVSAVGGVPAGNAIRRPVETNGGLTLTLSDDKKWENGQTVTVRFMGGSEFVRSKVKEYAVLWCQYASIQFQFVDEGDADIRVSFLNGGSHSKIGTDCLEVDDQDIPTMNFGWFDDQTSNAEFQRTTVHEFGHALGAHHEQNNPNLVVHWNKPVMYKYYLEHDHWDESTVDTNMFTPVIDADATAWDPLSIMHYKILPDFTFDHLSVPLNWVMSDQDKAFIKAMYPPTQGDKGYWLSSESGLFIQSSWSENIRYDRTYGKPPLLALGLNYLDAWHNPMGAYGIWLEAWAANNKRTMFDLHLQGYQVQNFGAGATWLEFDTATHPKVEVSTRGFSVDTPIPGQTWPIRFRHTYTAPPKVLVWLNSLAMGSGTASKCMGASVANVTATGCTVDITALNSDAVMFMGNLTYVVIPANTPNIQMGNVNAGVPGIGAVPGHFVTLQPQSNAIPVRFATAFSAPPKVFLALNALDYSRGDFVRLNAHVTDVSATGFTAHLDTWVESQMFGVTATWVAMM